MMAPNQDSSEPGDDAPIVILLVEDSPSDVVLTSEALRSGRIPHTLLHASDGEMAMQVLNQNEEFANAPRPDVVLLDLNLPKLNGFEVLAGIRQDPNLKSIPVIMMTMSARESDVISANGHSANCFITKPVQSDDFVAAVQAINSSRFRWARLPQE